MDPHFLVLYDEPYDHIYDLYRYPENVYNIYNKNRTCF